MFLSALGHSTEPKVPFLEAVVRDPQLRRERASGVREEPLQAGQGVPDQGGERQQVQVDERRQGGFEEKKFRNNKNLFSVSGWTGLLSTFRLQSAKSEAFDDHQCLWKTPYGAGKRQ